MASRSRATRRSRSRSFDPRSCGSQAEQPFVESDLTAAVGAIRGIYLRRGFAHSKISSAANERPPAPTGEGRVKPVITITEGPLTVVGTVSFSGNEAIASGELATRIRSGTGAPYFEPTVVQDRDGVLLEYRNRGFATATAEVSAQLAEDRSRVDLTFRITEGPQTLVDHVLIVGNVRTDEKVIAREIVLQPGRPLGLGDLIESRRRIAALGLFRRVQITEIAHAGSTKHDVLVTVEEAPSTTIGYGGGLEASERLQEASETGVAEERLEFAPRGFFEVGRRNLGGRNRSVNLFTRLSLRPDSSADNASGDNNLFGFAEYRVIGTYREPRSFGLNSDIIITGAIEQGIRSSFNFARKGVNVEVARRLNRQVRIGGRYSFNTTKTFDVTFDTETDEGEIAHDRPDLSAGAAVGVLRRDLTRHARRCGGSEPWAIPERGRHHRGACAWRRGRLRQVCTSRDCFSTACRSDAESYSQAGSRWAWLTVFRDWSSRPTPTAM